MKNIYIFRKPICLFLAAFFVMHVGWGQTTSITITNSTIGGSSILGSNAYNSGAERTWTQNSINFGGKAITCNISNSPSGATACQYIQAQASNGVIYNTSSLPGRLISVQITGSASVASSCFGEISRIVNSTSGNYTVSGTQIGTAQTNTSYTWSTASTDNYTFFCIKRGASAQYFSSIIVTYQTPTTVTYNSNSGFGSMTSQTAGIPTNLNSNTYSRTGYTFAGWNTAVNGSGTTYLDGASFPFTSNTTLYAQWTAVSSDNCPNGVSLNPTADQTVCQDISTTSITANPSYSGGTGTPTVQYQWYYNTTNSNTISGASAVSSATSDIFTPPSTSSEVGTRYYFCVAYATDNNCAQTVTNQSLASSAVKVTVNGTPSAPTGTASQSYCTGNTVSQLSAMGSSLAWYSAASGGSALNTATALTTSNYYATQTVNGCESSNRLAVAATVNSIPSAPTGTSAQTFCSGNTVANLSATGTAIQWYASASGGSALSSSSALSTTDYYASQNVNGCESSNRFQVAATVNSISTPTNVLASNATCSSFDLAWDAVNCASGYKLDVGDNKDFLSKNIVSWDFPNSPDNAIADGGIAANNTKSITVGGGVTGLNFAAGGATTNSANATGWDVGNGTKYWEVNFTTLGFYNTRISSKQRGSNSAPRDFKLQYKIGLSGTYTDVPSSNITVANNYTTGVISQLALPNVCDNQTSVYLRWIMTSNTSVNGSSVANTGSGNIDDILVEGLSPNYLSGYQDLSVSSTFKTVSGLSPNTKYYYRVRSTDGTNTSASSNVDSITTPALSMTTAGTVSPICYNAATSSSLAYSVAADNPNSYSIDWNSAANTAGLSDQTATSFTSSASGGTISSIAIPSNVAAGNYSGVMTITNAAGCSITKNISLTINALPSISITPSPSSAIVCSGSSVSLTATAGLSSYAWSSGSSTTNSATFSPTTTTTYTVTGTDANGCSTTASQTVNYYPASTNATLVSSSVTGAVEQCTESDGYTYYADPASPGQYLFGIYKNGNSFTATVDITVDNANKFKKSTSSNGANQEHASYIMSRYWNVNATGTVGTGVKVRFFVDPQDITDLQNARDNDYNTLKNTTNPSTLAVISGTENFKTVGTTYSPTNWTGNKYNGTIVKLTQDAVSTLNGQTYVELSGITSFSGGGIGAAFGPSSNGLFNSGGTVGLPVTWKDVKAMVKEEGNLIQWITSSEKNTSHFEVEYSYDAKNFFKASNNIKAAVNSTTDKSYDFVHFEEYGELVYYRIKQVDLDGKVDYSKAVVAKRTSKLPEFHVSMYPVPLNVHDLNLKIQTVQKTDITITINDLLGRSVYTESFSPQGYTTDHKLSLGHLQNGTYHVTIDNGMHKSVQVLVVGK